MLSSADLARCFPGDSEMARRMRALDWSGLALGPPHTWPQHLRIALGICLSSRFPMQVWWGSALTMFYNDAYISFLGKTKHPRVLGGSARSAWPEIWETIGPMLDEVLSNGKANWSEDILMFFDRTLPREEVYVTFSFSPVFGEDGAVGGAFCACTETTEKIIGSRRLDTLRKLGVQPSEAQTVAETCRTGADVMGENPRDLPFAAIYLLDEKDAEATLAATVGLAGADHHPLPQSVSCTHDDGSPWLLEQALRTRSAQEVDLRGLDLPLPGGPWPDPADKALVLPIPAHESLAGLLVVGVGPRRPLDDAYRAFFNLVAGHIGTRIAEARAYEAERRRAEALAELDRAKTAFFSNISHELRTPLTLIMGPVEDAMRENPAAHALLQVAHRNSLRLLKLVNTLLDFSRIEAGRMQATYEPVELAAFTAELASNFRSAIEKAGMRLAVHCDALREPVYVDREMWEKIVFNLLSNAFKFTLQGEIEVRLRDACDAVELTVRDTGTGIPESELPQLFERFHRAKGVQGRTYEGTGIGLALVRELVKLHAGTISVKSHVGAGTTFTVSLPRGMAHLPAERIGAGRLLASTAIHADAYVEEALQWIPDESAAQARAPGSAEMMATLPAHAGHLPDVANARILLAEDNADMRHYLCRLLQGWTVDAVQDGVAALQAALRDPPDLVLSDIMMPRMDGIELVRQLRAGENTRHLPVILLSARAGEEARVAGLETGADDYLVKPFPARELVARVETHLKLARMRREALNREQDLRAETVKVLESMGDAFMAFDPAWQITYVNAAAERINALPRERLLGKNLWETFPAICGTVAERELRRAMTQRVAVKFENYYPPYDQWYESDAFPVMDGGLAVYSRDITERKAMEDTIRHQAHYDALTDLPNRRLFLDMLSHELAAIRRSGSKFAVLFLDLDRFKYVNDTLGHHVGDELLVEVARRLRANVREADIVSRIGGDEFNILVSDIRRQQDVMPVAAKVLDAFKAPMQVGGHALYVTVSIGASICPDDAADLNTLFRNADIAMYHAKELGGNTYQFYNAAMNVRTIERLSLEAALRQSLNRRELVVYYQPMISAVSNEMVSAEALVRWRHPERGILSPLQFIPLAEETGFVSLIDEWVLRTACAQCSVWRNSGLGALRVSVNLSARQFQHADLVARIGRILEETGLDPAALDIEITESVAMANWENSIQHLRRLAAMGICIAIDDFGTGYSSLSYLKKLPICKLKIDKTFVQDIAVDSDDRAIITAITAMAQQLKFSVTAEGVETEEQLAFLRSAGCQEMQGYFFSRPLTAYEFNNSMRAH